MPDDLVTLAKGALRLSRDPTERRGRISIVPWDRPRSLDGYLWGVAAVIASMAVSQLGARYLQLADVIMIHLVGVVLISTRFGVVPSIATAVVSALSFDFFFIPPALSFALPDLKSTVTFSVMLAVAGVISVLTERLRRQEARARRGEARTAALYSMSREIAMVRTMDQLISVATRHIEKMFGAPTVILLAELDGSLPVPRAPHPMHLGEPQAARAQEAWLRRELVASAALEDHGVYLPLIGSHAPLGVLGILSDGSSQVRDAEHRELLETCSHQTATAIERALRVKDVQRAQVMVETERLRSSLLSAVSHDLKTPLTAILSAGTTLAKDLPSLDEATRSGLLTTVVQEAERLNALVTNLLAMTRLESGTVEIHRMEEAVEEVIGSALRRLTGRLEGRRVHTVVPAETPLVPMDPMLIEQVLINLLENAIKYTPPESAIEIAVTVEDTAVRIDVADRGPGVPLDEQEKVFEKFYRGHQGHQRDGGVGLGLTICRAIVQAHDGRIWIQNRARGGSSVQFTLPRALSEQGEPDALPEIATIDATGTSNHGE